MRLKLRLAVANWPLVRWSKTLDAVESDKRVVKLGLPGFFPVLDCPFDLFTASAMSGIQLTRVLFIPESDLVWSFSRSGGPGGQNVNKVSSKATLRWTPPDGFLAPVAWRIFARKAKRYLTTEGQVVIQSQEHRDRPQNVQACRDKLQSLLNSSLTPPKKRIPTKRSKASNQRRLTDKKQSSDKKRSRNWQE